MKRNTIIFIFFLLTLGGVIIQSCVSAKVADKSGTQLWSENCMRCHNTPPSSAFTNIQWDLISTHMKNRAMLTETEYVKILEFMQAGE